jgi:hypothetical protein
MGRNPEHPEAKSLSRSYLTITFLSNKRCEKSVEKMEVDTEGDRKAKGLPLLDGEGPLRLRVCEVVRR